MNRRKFIETSAMGLASLCTPSLLSAKPALESILFSSPEIIHPIVEKNTQLLLQQIQYHNTTYEGMLQYLHQHLDNFPTMETESEDLFTFYNRHDLLDLHPRQVTRAYIFMKSLEDPNTQKKIHAHLVDDFLDKKTEFGGRVTANKDEMVLEYLRDPSVDKPTAAKDGNLHYILPEGSLNTPHIGLYHGHAVLINNTSRGILSGEEGDAGNTQWNANIMGEDHQLMFNLQIYGFDIIYYGTFPKENGFERFHMRLGNYYQ